MIHLIEQVKLIELETLQVKVKSHGQQTYSEKKMKSTQHVFYANASLHLKFYAANIIFPCI